MLLIHDTQSCFSNGTQHPIYLQGILRVPVNRRVNITAKYVVQVHDESKNRIQQNVHSDYHKSTRIAMELSKACIIVQLENLSLTRRLG